MKVTAIAKGHDGLTVRIPGETFDMPDGSKSPWFVTASDGDEFTEADINAAMQKISDNRAAALLAADRASAIANLVVLRAESARINTDVAQAAERKVTADNALKDANAQSESASTDAERQAAKAAVAKAQAAQISAEAAVVANNDNHDAFVRDNYPNQTSPYIHGQDTLPAAASYSDGVPTGAAVPDFRKK